MIYCNLKQNKIPKYQNYYFHTISDLKLTKLKSGKQKCIVITNQNLSVP